MNKLVTVVFFSAIVILSPYNIAPAQNPCNEIGQDCRSMTANEAKAFKERLLAVKALLPVPDPARYEHDGAAEASTMPFIAETGIANAVLTCRSWPEGCFAENPYNSLDFAYLAKSDSEKNAGKPKDLLAATMSVANMFENRIEVSVWLLPHPYLMDSELGPDAVNVEKGPTFLSWESGEDVIELQMIFGPRTSNEADTLIGEKPAKNFAPVKSIEMIISGPKTEVAALKKKINRQAFEALLGAVLK